jgi:hypothetical protein
VGIGVAVGAGVSVGDNVSVFVGTKMLVDAGSSVTVATAICGVGMGSDGAQAVKSAKTTMRAPILCLIMAGGIETKRGLQQGLDLFECGFRIFEEYGFHPNLFTGFDVFDEVIHEHRLIGLDL